MRLEVALAAGMGFLTTLIIALHLASLTVYPPVFIDEPWYANAAWNWRQTGINFDTMHAGVLDQFGYEWMRWPFIGNAPWLIAFAALGLGLFQARLVSWVFGVILLGATFLVGRQKYGVITGALAALLLSLSQPFLQASHYARPDIMLAAFIMIAYGMALAAFHSDRRWLHFAAGLLWGLAIDIHPNALMFAPGLAGLYAVTYGARVLRRAEAWLCAAGGLLGLAYYVVSHVLPSPSAYLAVNRFMFGGSHGAPVQTLQPLGLLTSFLQEIGRYHFYENNLEFALIGASIAYLTIRRLKADRLLLVFVGATFACFVLFVGNKHDVYAILFYPFLMLMVAEALTSLLRAPASTPLARGFLAALLALLLVNGAQHFIRPVVRNRGYNYYAVTEQIRSVIPQGARVIGLPNWWLGLADYDYRSSLSLTYYHLYNGYSLTEGLEAMRPDVLIVDSGLRGLLVNGAGFPSGPGFEIYQLPRQEFEDFLTRRGEVLLAFSNPWHGEFKIFVVHWD